MNLTEDFLNMVQALRVLLVEWLDQRTQNLNNQAQCHQLYQRL
jgi:predicted DNA-binding ribbon-helix-helix protein